MGKKVLIVGGLIYGVQAALDLADYGCEVTLVEEAPTLSSRLPGGGPEAEHMLAPMPLKAVSHPRIRVLTNSSLAQLAGTPGHYSARIAEQPRYVNTATCTACGRCEQECPVTIVSPDGKSSRHKAAHSPAAGRKAAPAAYLIEKKGVPPCTATCPAGINVQGYVALISQGKFNQALDLITKAVPFPRVLGRVCPHPCEEACTRGKVDKPVSICALKRYVADHGSTVTSLKRAQDRPVKLEGPARVAIIGAGPAGLSAARDLARLGHRSTVFEALPVPGGMITVGMPRFRLPREIRQADIEDILRLGIDIRTSTPIGKDLTIDDLKRQGYRAILIATGAHMNQKLGIPGEGLSGVIDSVAFLQALNLKQRINVGKNVVIVGGGYTAIDSARTAVRLHCDRATILYRRSLEEMPANREEVAEAQDEGVEIEFQVAPVRILGQDGKVSGIECLRMGLGEPEKSGRRRPVPIPGSEFIVRADTVIVAVGQRPDLSFLGGYSTLCEGKQHVIVDSVTMATKVPGIFAAGDAAGEPGAMIQAIAAGRRAAVSIDRYLRGQDLESGRTLMRQAPVDVDIHQVYVPEIARQEMPCLEQNDRLGNFEEVDLGLDMTAALKEAARCLNCAGCSECLECERACAINAVQHHQVRAEHILDFDAVVIGGDSQYQKTPGAYALPQDGGLWQASAVAARVMTDMAVPAGQAITSPADKGEPVPVRKPVPGPVTEPRIGVFICRCGGSISLNLDVAHLSAEVRSGRSVVTSHIVDDACSPEAAAEIKKLIARHGVTHAVVAACACCNYGQICLSCTEKRIQCKRNLLADSSGVYYEFVNIREHCAWVHGDHAEARAKAAAIIKAGIARARAGQMAPAATFRAERSVVVVGSGLAAMRCAADLAVQGFPTVLVTVHPFNGSKDAVRQSLQETLLRQGAKVIAGAVPVSIDGSPGRYRVRLLQNGETLELPAGAVVVEAGAVRDLAAGHPLTGLVPDASPEDMASSRLPGVFVLSNDDSEIGLSRGAAAATRAALFLGATAPDPDVVPAAVNAARCRGCGECVAACQFGAVKMVPGQNGAGHAHVEESLCRGCGLCLARCPTGAISQSGYDEKQVEGSVRALLG